MRVPRGPRRAVKEGRRRAATLKTDGVGGVAGVWTLDLIKPAGATLRVTRLWLARMRPQNRAFLNCARGGRCLRVGAWVCAALRLLIPGRLTICFPPRSMWRFSSSGDHMSLSGLSGRPMGRGCRLKRAAGVFVTVWTWVARS